MELKCIARQRKIKNYMKMKKDKLISMLEVNDKDPTVLSDPEFNEECKTYAAAWRQNNPERILIYHEKFRESVRLDHHKRKQAAEDYFDLDRKDYENMTIYELRHIGKNRKIKYYTSMSKNKFIGLLKINDKDPFVKSYPEFKNK